jgi:hypothetical protein
METITSLSSRSLQYYAIARKWKARLEFISLEVNFLRYLIDEHLFSPPDTNLRRAACDMKDRLISLEFQKNTLYETIKGQLFQLELMAEDVVAEDVSELVATQIGLEYRIDEISAEYRELKKQIFALIKGILDSRKKPLFYCFPN